jgi:microcystin-dependent protein
MESYMSEIQIFAFPFAPKYWAQCNGQSLPIAQNQALFALLGIQFGGNGTTTFNLPDLRGRTAVGATNSGQFVIGEAGGEENHALSINEMPAHNHTLMASTNTADLPNADGNLLAAGGTHALYSNSGNNTALAGNFIGQSGNGIGHPNIQPYLVVNCCICLQGIFPPRN